jgi:hypothetical protein
MNGSMIDSLVIFQRIFCTLMIENVFLRTIVICWFCDRAMTVSQLSANDLPVVKAHSEKIISFYNITSIEY